MKKKAMLIVAAGVIVLTAGCGNQGTGKTETTAAATTAAATTAAAETTAAEVKETETAAEVTAPEMKTYKDSKGWQVKYATATAPSDNPVSACTTLMR